MITDLTRIITDTRELQAEVALRSGGAQSLVARTLDLIERLAVEMSAHQHRSHANAVYQLTTPPVSVRSDPPKGDTP